MSQTLFGAPNIVTILNRAFNNASPANAFFNNQVNQAGTTAASQTAFANNFGASFAGLTNAQLSARVLGNIGVLPNPDLQRALTDYFGSVDISSRGLVVVQLGLILETLETAPAPQDIFNAAAKAWNTEVGQSYIYSSNVANTTAYNGDFAPAPPNQGQTDPVTPNQGQTFTLTTAAETFTGTAGNDVFNATVPGTFNPLDSVDGGAGDDTLNVADYNTAVTTAGRVVKNIETANLSSVASVNADTTGWTGLTKLTTTSTGANTVTAATTTAVTVSAGTLAGAAVSVNGGSDITIAATGTTTGTITVGATTAATGVITIKDTIAGASAAGAIAVTGGTKVAITQTSSNAGATHGAVTVTGIAGTTSVSSTTTASVVGATNNTVTINDVNNGATSKASTIADVTVSGYTTVALGSNALTTLSLANGSGNVIIDNQAATVVNKTLSLTVNNLTGGTLDDADIYTTLNVTTTGANSTLANVTFGALTALTVAGGKVLTLTSTAGASALKTVTVTGAAGLTAAVSQASVTAVDTSGSTGTSTITLDATKATFTGGAGVDNVTTSAAAPTKAISLGAGNDSLTLASGTTTVTGAISGGDGTDTLSMTAANAATASGSAAFATAVTGFERLTLTAATNNTVDVAALGNYNYVKMAGGNGVTLSGLVTGATLELTAAGTAYNVSLSGAAVSSTADVLNIVTSNGTGMGINFASTGVTVANTETVNITTADIQTSQTNERDLIGLVDAGNQVKTVMVSGSDGLNLTFVGTGAATVDASGLTKGDFTFTSGALASAATIKGGLVGTNIVDFSAATKVVTYTGGAGADVVTGNTQNSVVSLGDGSNSYSATAGNHTVTAGAGNDTVTLTTGNNTVNLGNGTNSFTATTGNNTYVGGTGVDTITVGAGTNTITTGAGADIVTITTPGANVNTYTTITDAAAGDQIAFTNLGTETFVSTKVTLTNLAVFEDYANGVVAGAIQSDHSMDGAFGWFQFNGDTYLVEVRHDTSSGINQSFVNGTDQIVKLTGLVDLSTATGGTTNILTLA